MKRFIVLSTGGTTTIGLLAHLKTKVPLSSTLYAHPNLGNLRYSIHEHIPIGSSLPLPYLHAPTGGTPYFSKISSLMKEAPDGTHVMVVDDKTFQGIPTYFEGNGYENAVKSKTTASSYALCINPTALSFSAIALVDIPAKSPIV